MQPIEDEKKLTIKQPDWETRVKMLKVVFSLLPKARKAKILDSLKLSDEQLSKRFAKAISQTDIKEIRWGAKKKRFYILKRDKFTCQYCGRSAPEVILEVDHILAVANGGDSNNKNLITACRDCNAGKGASEL